MMSMRSVNIRPVFTLARGLQLARLQIEIVSCDGYIEGETSE